MHCHVLHRKLNILSSKTAIIAVLYKKIGAAKREELHCPIPWGGLLSVKLPHCSDEQPFTFPVARRTHAGHFPARAAPAPANPLATPIPKAEEQRLPCRNLSIRHSFTKHRSIHPRVKPIEPEEKPVSPNLKQSTCNDTGVARNDLPPPQASENTPRLRPPAAHGSRHAVAPPARDTVEPYVAFCKTLV